MSSPSADHTVVLHVMPGEVLDDRWRLEDRIGQGAMGSVFRGRDVKTGQLVAVKVLAPEHCRKPKVLARFEREAELMMELRHPNIVQLLGHGRLRALPYIVMEYLDGMTLSEVLEAKGGHLPVAETVALVKPIAAGLAFLHRAGLVHRDIKPQNIFLTTRGRVTILDLGVVRDQHNPGLTKPGAMVGTPYYMSPEQILGVEDIDRRTDVYSLAAMTFELLTGRPPYLGSNNFEVLYGHKNTAVPDAASLVKSITKQVAQVLIRGMAKRREDRPETASEFAAELEAAVGVKKVDLVKAFAFVAEAKKKQQRRDAKETRDAPPVADKGIEVESTRLIQKYTPARKDSDEVPLAANEDVVSVANVIEADSIESKTEIFSTDATYVGPITRETSAPRPAPSHGHVRVITTLKGKPVSATFAVSDGTKGATPKTVSLRPGRYSIRAELAGSGRSLERKVDVAAGATVNVRLEF
ncbi:MAG: serine/threonine protein kinase [Myxococcaceae bacterium]|nr:serine/threonine protein kinase [Myxococcaceae bacterium]